MCKNVKDLILDEWLSEMKFTFGIIQAFEVLIYICLYNIFHINCLLSMQYLYSLQNTLSQFKLIAYLFAPFLFFTIIAIAFPSQKMHGFRWGFLIFVQPSSKLIIHVICD